MAERFLDTSRDFIGVEETRKREENGTSILLAYLVFDDEIECECFGNEAVYHNAEVVGLTNRGAFGHLGYRLALAYVPPELIKQDQQLEILSAQSLY